MRHTAIEKSILPPDNFTGHFQNGFGPLFETARQPCGILQTFGDIGFFNIIAARRRYPHGIGLVDKYFW